MKIRIKHETVRLSFIASFLFVAGCNMDIKDYCTEWADCEKGNNADKKACTDDLKAERKVADIYGCKTQFDDLIACEVDNARCIEVTYNTNSLSSYYEDYSNVSEPSPIYEYTDEGNCTTVESAYESCTSAARE